MTSGLQIDGEGLLPAMQRAACVRGVESVLEAAQVGELGLGVTFVDDEAIAILNRQWRGIDAPTDVLSFAAHDGEVIAGLEDELGDLVIAVPTAMRQAQRLGHPLSTEIAVLTAHGLLHLCGFDHEPGAKQAQQMAELELSILHAAGIPVGVALIGRSLAQP
jgi:probable rRNA maturation factor